MANGRSGSYGCSKVIPYAMKPATGASYCFFVTLLQAGYLFEKTSIWAYNVSHGNTIIHGSRDVLSLFFCLWPFS